MRTVRLLALALFWLPGCSPRSGDGREPATSPERSAVADASPTSPPVAGPSSSAAASSASSVPTLPSAAPVPSAAPPVEPPKVSEPLPENTVVLHIGDSMAGALGVALNDELKLHKVKGMLRFKTASYIPGWAGGLDLPLYISQYKPDLVLITLGTNEVKMPDPTQRAPLVRKIVKLVGDRPCVWIAPPVWTSEKGLYQVIKENVAPCRYMDTEQVYGDMPRLNDKIHPTIGARKEWAKRVVDWLAKERRPTAERPWALAPE